MLRRVLVVEDEQRLAELVKAFLVEKGYAVLLAYDGEKGMEVARRERPDLVLSDVLLPRLTGWELCRRIKADPVLQDMRVVLMTAVYTKSRYRTEAIEVGADDFVSKPLDLEDLAVRLARLLSAGRPAPRARMEDPRVPSPAAPRQVVAPQPLVKESAPPPRPREPEPPAPRPTPGASASPSVPAGPQAAPVTRREDPRAPSPPAKRETVAPQTPSQNSAPGLRPREPEPAPRPTVSAAAGSSVPARPQAVPPATLEDPFSSSPPVKREGMAPVSPVQESVLPPRPKEPEPPPHSTVSDAGRPPAYAGPRPAPRARVDDLAAPFVPVNREAAASQPAVKEPAPPPRPQSPEPPAPRPIASDPGRLPTPAEPRPAPVRASADAADLLFDLRSPDPPRPKRAAVVDVAAALAGLVPPPRKPAKGVSPEAPGARNEPGFNERLAAMRRSFAAALPGTLLKIERAWVVAAGGSEVSAWEDFARLAHDLAGSAGSFGFPAVGDAARELEEVVRVQLESGRPLGGKARLAVKQYIERLGALVHLL